MPVRIADEELDDERDEDACPRPRIEPRQWKVFKRLDSRSKPLLHPRPRAIDHERIVVAIDRVQVGSPGQVLYGLCVRVACAVATDPDRTLTPTACLYPRETGKVCRWQVMLLAAGHLRVPPLRITLV